MTPPRTSEGRTSAYESRPAQPLPPARRSSAAAHARWAQPPGGADGRRPARLGPAPPPLPFPLSPRALIGLLSASQAGHAGVAARQANRKASALPGRWRWACREPRGGPGRPRQDGGGGQGRCGREAHFQPRPGRGQAAREGAVPRLVPRGAQRG